MCRCGTKGHPQVEQIRKHPKLLHGVFAAPQQLVRRCASVMFLNVFLLLTSGRQGMTRQYHCMLPFTRNTAQTWYIDKVNTNMFVQCAQGLFFFFFFLSHSDPSYITSKYSSQLHTLCTVSLRLAPTG